MKINNESEYEKASERTDELFEKKPASGTPEKEELDELLKALKAYEDNFIKMLKNHG
jgi:antitoxin component HigA of HigAB toxin-antitoxin module